MKVLGIQYVATEWMLFLDSFKSIKSALLHIGNKLPLVSVAHLVKLNECYVDMKHLPHALCYDLHQWKLCGNLKVIAILLGTSRRLY